MKSGGENMTLDELKIKILQELQDSKRKSFRGTWFEEIGIDINQGREALYQLKEENLITFSEHMGGPAYGTVELI